MDFFTQRRFHSDKRRLKLGQIVDAGARLEWNAHLALNGLLAVSPTTGARISRTMNLSRALDLCGILAEDLADDAIRPTALSAVVRAREAARTRNVMIHSRWINTSNGHGTSYARIVLDPRMKDGEKVVPVDEVELNAAIDQIDLAATGLGKLARDLSGMSRQARPVSRAATATSRKSSRPA